MMSWTSLNSHPPIGNHDERGKQVGSGSSLFSLTSLQAIGIEVFRFELEDLKLNGVAVAPQLIKSKRSVYKTIYFKCL